MNRFLFLMGAAMALGASSAWATDWSSYAGQEVTIPSDETWTVAEGDMAAFNAVTSVTFADATSVLIFR